MAKNPFFLFARGRSGGSTLQHSITAGINVEQESIGEPFASEEQTQMYSNAEPPKEKLKEEVEEVKKNNCGIKVNSHRFEGVDRDKVEGPTKSLMKTVIDCFDHVIINGRYNFLKSAMSERIATQFDKWHINSEEERIELIENSKTWQEDLEAVEHHIKRKKNLWDEYIDYIENSNMEIFRAYYEDIFEHTTLEERVEKVKRIVNWLGYEFDEEHIGAIHHLLSSDRKVSTKDVYLLIENIEEINETFGPEFGFLF